MSTERSSVPTCGFCRCWVKQPADPLNLGAPPQGECRERVHSASLPMRGPGGQQALQQVAYYPVLREGFPICSHFAPRPTLAAAFLGG